MLRVRLKKNLARSIKRGHAWLFSDAVEIRKDIPGGTPVLVLPQRGEVPVASGMYDPRHPITVRICRTEPPWKLDAQWLHEQLLAAANLRTGFGDGTGTTGYRLVAGEGDRLPGLIIDIYAQTAVVKLDGGAPEAFYDVDRIAAILREEMGIQRVVLRHRQRGRVGQVVCGSPLDGPVTFLENGLTFTADCLRGQKTGFFLDQRENRHLVRTLAMGRAVLNLFAYSGGFSVAAGVGGARRVTSVDIAAPAIEAAKEHWQRNGLPDERHEAITEDCFAFLERAVTSGRKWDLVISDPPSFAPSQRSRSAALSAYRRLTRMTAAVTSPGGLLALASCSSHISAMEFLEHNLEELWASRRRATLVAQQGLPVDHPTPAAMPEMRYLKFLLFRLDN